MFKSLLSKIAGKRQEKIAQKIDPGPSTAILLETIEKKRKTDPAIGVKTSGTQVFNKLLSLIQDEQGLHTETLLCALGALAGYACQESLRHRSISKGMDQNTFFKIVNDRAGNQYFFSPELGELLIGSKHSIWKFSTNAIERNGNHSQLNPNEILSYVLSCIGKPSFGILRVPPLHQSSYNPIDCLKMFWPIVFPIVKKFSKRPTEWPLAFGFAIHEALDISKDVINPELALKVIMESALPAAMFDRDRFSH